MSTPVEAPLGRECEGCAERFPALCSEGTCEACCEHAEGVTCEDCSTHTHDEPLCDSLCQECCGERHGTCERCDEHGAEVYENGCNQGYCERCHDRAHTVCPHCENHVDHVCSECDRCIDHDCCEGHEPQDDDEAPARYNVRRASPHITFHKATRAQHKRNRSKRFAATEIEAIIGPGLNSSSAEDVARTWGAAIVGDGSLPSGGFEINTAPASGDVLLQQVTEFCRALNSEESKATEACGLHVHVDARDHTYDDIAKLMLLYMAIEDVLFAMQPSKRRSSQYCFPSTKPFHDVLYPAAETVKARSVRVRLQQSLYGAQAITRGIKKVRTDKYHSARYRALNLHSWLHRGTVEFRMHSGTTMASKINPWIMLCLAIVDKAYGTPYRELERACEFAGSLDDKVALLMSLAPSSEVSEYIRSRLGKFSPAVLNSYDATQAQVAA